MKKFPVITLLLCLVLLLQPMVVYAETQDPNETTESTQQIPQIPDDAGFDKTNNTVINGCHSVDARYPINGSNEVMLYTDSAVLYEVTSDTLVYTYDADKRMNPSSLVKIMTALLAMEYCDPTDVVICRQGALDSVMEGALIAYLSDGEELTVEQLLNVMLVGSCNDAAAVLADHISGSQENFVNLMNRRAAELGCQDTVFKNCTGLHHEDQVTSARDMVRILREAIKYPVFVEAFGAPNYWLPETNRAEARYFLTTNYMISDESYLYYKDSRVTGGRTGTMHSGEYSFAATASINGGTYIVVTLGSDEYFSLDTTQPFSHGSFVDTSFVLDIASASNLVNVVDPEQIVDQIPIRGGDHHVVIGSMETVSCVLPPDYNWDMITMRTELLQNSLEAPVKAGTKVANAQFWYGNICIGETELFTLIDVPVSQALLAPADPGDSDGFDAGALSTALMVLGGIFALILVLFGGLFMVRTVRTFIRDARLNRRSKERRKERRRSK